MSGKQTNEEKTLVCVGPDYSSTGWIRAAGMMANSMNKKWFAVYVEQTKAAMLPESERNRAIDNLKFAEQLGAETFILNGKDIAEEILKFARREGVTKIVAGRPRPSRLRRLFLSSPVDKLVRAGGDVDIEIVSGEPVEPAKMPYPVRSRRISWSDYGTGILFLILATGLSFLMYPFLDLSNLIMVYLLCVLITAIDCGRGPAVLVSMLSVLSFDFFFVPPRFSFTVDEVQYVFTFIVMFLVALTISHLATTMRKQIEIARLHERMAAAMHGLSRQLVSSRGVEQILEVSVRYISEIFDSQTLILLPGKEGKLEIRAGDPASVIQKDVVREFEAARLAYVTGKVSYPQSTASSEIIYVPMKVSGSVLGVVALRPGDPERFLIDEQRNLLESLVQQVALALEVSILTERAAA